MSDVEAAVDLKGGLRLDGLLEGVVANREADTLGLVFDELLIDKLLDGGLAQVHPGEDLLSVVAVEVSDGVTDILRGAVNVVGEDLLASGKRDDAELAAIDGGDGLDAGKEAADRGPEKEGEGEDQEDEQEPGPERVRVFADAFEHGSILDEMGFVCEPVEIASRARG